MTARDPCTGVGDLLRPRAGTQARLVLAVYRRYEVSYRSLGPHKAMNVCSLARWRQWCRREGAEVVEREDVA